MLKKFFSYCYELWEDEPGEFVFEVFVTLFVTAVIGGALTGLAYLTIHYFFIMMWIYFGIFIMIVLPTCCVLIGKHIQAKQE